MERIIKFRVWEKQSKIWIGRESSDWVGSGIGNLGLPDEQPWKCMSLKGEIMSNDNMGGFVEPNQENYNIQQFTGLLDKNGKEIYEGDIIKVTWTQPKYRGIYGNNLDREIVNQICEVIFEDGKYACKPYCSLHEFIYINKNSEIIGNIFENPDLLT